MPWLGGPHLSAGMSRKWTMKIATIQQYASSEWWWQLGNVSDWLIVAERVTEGEEQQSGNVGGREYSGGNPRCVYVCATKAERVCWLVLPGAHTCWPLRRQSSSCGQVHVGLGVKRVLDYP